jgi:CheY-like chemotaxis protein
MMQSGILPNTEFNQALSVISRNANSLKRLINDLLDMSAILSGKMRIDETLLSLADVLSESVDTMRPYARQANVDLQLEIADGASALIIKGDHSRLSQVFCNILNNAIKFSPAGGYVQVSCEAGDSAATVRIVDQGKGIPAEFLPHVFERFRQADGSRTRAYGGLGLGLALVKSFVQAHGGTIEAASNGVGKGSEFVIKLPREALPTGENGKKEPKLPLEKHAKRARVLIVEDQLDTLEMLAAHFQTRGYEALPCSSAAEAITIADREPFDILISDIAMPEMDGLQLIRTLRQKKGLDGIPAIALTGYASEKDAEMAIAAGFNTHLAKPIEPARLSAVVERLLNFCQSREP